MLKRLGLFAALLFSCSLSHALGNFEPSRVYEVGIATMTTTIISVSTSTVTGATQMDNPLMNERVTIEIQNIDASANLWCVGGRSNPTVNGARKIAAGNSWIVSILDRTLQTGGNPTSTFNFWCLSDGAAATSAAVTQIH